MIHAQQCNGVGKRAQVSEDGTPPRWVAVDVEDIRPGALFSGEDLANLLVMGYVKEGETWRNRATGELWRVTYVIAHHFAGWRLVNEAGEYWRHRRTWGRE